MEDTTTFNDALRHEQALAANYIGAIVKGGARGSEHLGDVLTQFAYMKADDRTIQGKSCDSLIKNFEADMHRSNAIAKAMRENRQGPGRQRFADPREMQKSGQYAPLQKAALDVSGLTDLAQFSQGQALGIVSQDYRLARGTVFPDSCVLYNMLNKTRANQIVDFWPVVSDLGGGLPGSVYSDFSTQTNGSVTMNQGTYSNQYLRLKYAIDGRGLTMALAAQTSFVDIAEIETANATMNILMSIEWATYWGNPTIYPNQPNGIYNQILVSNTFNYQDYILQASVMAQGLSPQQALFNQMYQIAGYVVGQKYGRTTHAFMPPSAIGDLQGLVTTKLMNVVNNLPGTVENRGLVIDGNLIGMNTSYGDMLFANDLYIGFRHKPAQAYINEVTGASKATLTIAPPTSVVATLIAPGNVAAGSVSKFSSVWASGAANAAVSYEYAVAMTDSAMNESIVTYSGVASGVVNGGGVGVVITPAATGTAFRVFRSGVGYALVANQLANHFRWIGDVACNGLTAVTFVDLNAQIPGSETIFLLDLDDFHDALDYRWMLPIVRVDLFAGSPYMPWAVAHIGAPRLRIPKWHAVIKNYVAVKPDWSPLATNI